MDIEVVITSHYLEEEFAEHLYRTIDKGNLLEGLTPLEQHIETFITPVHALKSTLLWGIGMKSPFGKKLHLYDIVTPDSFEPLSSPGSDLIHIMDDYYRFILYRREWHNTDVLNLYFEVVPLEEKGKAHSEIVTGKFTINE